jgi:hypothetical protein
LKSSSYTYNGKAKKLAVTVKDSNGKIIGNGNYTVAYQNNVKVGKATATKKVKKNSTTKLTVKKLKHKKKYYVRVRTYKVVKGKKYCSSWSKGKTVTIKK